MSHTPDRAFYTRLLLKADPWPFLCIYSPPCRIPVLQVRPFWWIKSAAYEHYLLGRNRFDFTPGNGRD